MHLQNITSPLLAILVFATAIVTAHLVLRRNQKAHDLVVLTEKGRYQAIDGLRGFLAIGVFIHHITVSFFFLQNGRWEAPPSQLYAHLGKTCVILFFMVTAFLFWGRVLDKRDNIDWLEFFISRLYRLYPAYLFMFLIVIAIVMASTGFQLNVSAGSLITSLFQWLMFTGSSPPLPPDINGFNRTWMLVAGVTWSLRYEWLFYLALPFLASIFARTRQPLFSGISLLAILVFVTFFGTEKGLNPKLLACFLGGVAAAYWVRRPVLAKIGRTWVGGLVAIISLGAVIGLLPPNSPLAVCGLTLFFIVIASGHDFWGVLRIPAVLLMGGFSYSLYILHGLIVWLVFIKILPSFMGGVPSELSYLLVAPIATMLLITLCTLTFILIEHPAIVAGKRHYRLLSSRLTEA